MMSSWVVAVEFRDTQDTVVYRRFLFFKSVRRFAFLGKQTGVSMTLDLASASLIFSYFFLVQLELNIAVLSGLRVFKPLLCLVLRLALCSFPTVLAGLSSLSVFLSPSFLFVRVFCDLWGLYLILFWHHVEFTQTQDTIVEVNFLLTWGYASLLYAPYWLCFFTTNTTIADLPALL